MNLILDRWIPVIRRNGSFSLIAPWEISSSYEDNPVVAIHSFRPDFDGALTQLLVGLLQTAWAPEDEDDWADFWDAPPSPETLLGAFKKFEAAFMLDADGPRFFQDLDPLEEGEACSVGELLVGYPSAGNTIKFNRDHFVKRDTVNAICPTCCAVALAAHQTFASGGGQGYRASLRRSSPVTAMLKSIEPQYQTLWATVWLNTMDEDVFAEIPGNHARKSLADIFPWMGPTATSSEDEVHLPADANPLQAYWGMPRRVRVDFTSLEEGSCDLCGEHTEKLIKTFKKVTYGFNYEGWEHPLSPHKVNPKKVKEAVNFSDDEITYRYWPTFVLPPVSRKKQEMFMSPKVVSHFFQQRIRETEATLHVFGFSMSNMKVKRWNEAYMPVFNIPEKIRGDYRKVVVNMATVAESISFDLQKSSEKARKFLNKEKYPVMKQGFLQQTEPLFYAILKKLVEDFEHKNELMEAWLKEMKRYCLRSFDRHVTDAFVRKGEMADVLTHRKTLKEKISGKVNRQLLGLS